MKTKSFRTKCLNLFRKISKVFREYWIDFWEGLFPTIQS